MHNRAFLARTQTIVFYTTLIHVQTAHSNGFSEGVLFNNNLCWSGIAAIKMYPHVHSIQEELIIIISKQQN